MKSSTKVRAENSLGKKPEKECRSPLLEKEAAMSHTQGKRKMTDTTASRT